MANKTGRGGGKPVTGNVVSLFGTHEGPTLAVDMEKEEFEKAKQLMISGLQNLIKSIEEGQTDGIIAIGLRATNGEFGAESYVGGPGVFGNVDRAVGIIELVKFDLIKEIRSESSG